MKSLGTLVACLGLREWLILVHARNNVEGVIGQVRPIFTAIIW